MSTEEALERVEARVTGRVQGVGFRYFIQEIANRLHLAGWVRNAPDGSVELVAEGTRPYLDELLAAARQGPAGSRVDRVEHRFSSSEGPKGGFRIRH